MNENEFETVHQTAQRLGVTVRAVQKWAASGKIEGAKKLGRSWLIPKGVSIADSDEAREANGKQGFRIPMPLLNACFKSGTCLEYIESIEDENDRKIALGEYYYFTGKAEQAVLEIEEFLDSDDTALAQSAALICLFANLSRGHIHLTRFALRRLDELIEAGAKSEIPAVRVMSVFNSASMIVSMHSSIEKFPPIEVYLRYLTEGHKLWSCYLLAHKSYLEKDYSRALTIVDMALALCPCECPIATIYLQLMAVISLMNLKQTDKAKERMTLAWEIARYDGFIEPFAQHHSLLQGMIEVFFKKDYPEDFAKIMNVVNSFSPAWRKVHNHINSADVADNLTTTEFTVAMLYSHGWSVKEIAAHIGLSNRTVTNYISTIYSKLCINDRNDLGKFMLK